ncbi:unnamed protein product [Ectocarpus sp. 8 AP-2014]
MLRQPVWGTLFLLCLSCVLSCGSTSNTSHQRDFLVTGHKYGHTRQTLRL